AFFAVALVGQTVRFRHTAIPASPLSSYDSAFGRGGADGIGSASSFCPNVQIRFPCDRFHGRLATARHRPGGNPSEGCIPLYSSRITTAPHPIRIMERMLEQEFV